MGVRWLIPDVKTIYILVNGEKNMSQIELDHKESTGQNLRKEAINWTNLSKSRATVLGFAVIDSEISFDYTDSTKWYDSKNWNYINTIKSSKTIHVIGGRN